MGRITDSFFLSHKNFNADLLDVQKKSHNLGNQGIIILKTCDCTNLLILAIYIYIVIKMA